MSYIGYPSQPSPAGPPKLPPFTWVSVFESGGVTESIQPGVPFDVATYARLLGYPIDLAQQILDQAVTDGFLTVV